MTSTTPTTTELLRSALGETELVAYRRVSADGELFIVATRRAGRTAIGELDLDASPGRYWLLKDLGMAPSTATIGAALNVGLELVERRLLSEGLYPEPTRNPRLAALRLAGLAGDRLALEDTELLAALVEPANVDVDDEV